MSRLVTAAVAVLVTALALGAAAAPAASPGARVALRPTSIGTVLVDARGHTLYLFAKDTRTASACAGACATAWPPLLTKGAPVAAPGVRAGLLGTVRRANGALQVTYAGHPLYLYAADRRAGAATGQGVGGAWFALDAQGRRVLRGATVSAGSGASPATPATPDPTPSPAPPAGGGAPGDGGEYGGVGGY